MWAISFPGKNESLDDGDSKGLLAKFYPHIDSVTCISRSSRSLRHKTLLTSWFKTMKYNERGDGIFRFWRDIDEDGAATSGYGLRLLRRAVLQGDAR